MEEKFELLEKVHQDASMGAYTIQKLLDNLKDRDNKIKSFAEEIMKEYQKFEEDAKNILEENDKEVANASIMEKMGSSMGISKEVKADNSDSAIADMLIKGISTGSIEIEKKLKAYENDIDKKHKKIAHDYLKFQEKTIDKLKKYL